MNGRAGRRVVGLAVVAFAAAALGAGPTAENGVTAHRGDSWNHPENSLEAFRAANAIGADWIETDVHQTKDGQLVIAHNPTTGAYCSRDLNIGASTYAELAALDLAETFRARRKLTLAQCPRQRIVRLEEVLDLILKEKKARLSIQPKSECVDAVMALVRAKGAVSWVGFNDGSLPKMARVKELEPSVPVFWDRFGSDMDKDVEVARTHGFESIVLFWKDATAEKVAKLKAAGFKVGVWTVNDPAELARFLEMGVQRIYTDDPKTLLGLVRAAARRVNP